MVDCFGSKSKKSGVINLILSALRFFRAKVATGNMLNETSISAKSLFEGRTQREDHIAQWHLLPDLSELEIYSPECSFS